MSSSCGHANPPSAKFCETCGVELSSSAAKDLEADQLEAEFLLDRVKESRSALLAVAVLFSIGAAIEIAMTEPELQMWVAAFDGVLVAAFWVIWAIAPKRPFGAAAAGLGLYIAIQAMNAMAEPETLFKGVIIKVFVIAALGKAVQAGFAHRKFVREKGLD